MISPMMILAGLGLFALIGAFTFWDDDDAAAQPTDPQPIPPDEGTEGDDTITAYDLEADEDGILSTLGGDDALQIEDSGGFLAAEEVDLGDGDDTIDGYTFFNGNSFDSIIAGDGDDVITGVYLLGGPAEGGAGDDIITAEGANGVLIDGGEGDDYIEIANGDAANNASQLQGGEGDDTINVFNAVQADLREIGGGDGADIFGLATSDHGFGSAPPVEPGYVADVYIATITDFVPGEDRVVIDPYTYADTASYTGYEITDDPSGAGSILTVEYAHPDDPVAVLQLQIFVNVHLTPADIEIVDQLTRPAAIA